MPRYYKRRYNKKKTLSTRKIFSRTSAKSQANQIYALRKKINYVYKRTHPDWKIKVGSAVTSSFTSSALSNVWAYQNMPVISGGYTDDDRTTNYVKVKSFRIFISAEYYNNSTTGYHNSESSGCQCRIIAVQYKAKTSTAASAAIGDIIDGASNTGAQYTLLAVKPLKTDITQTFKVLADRRFTITSDNNQKMFSMSIKPNNFRYDGNGDGNYVRLYFIVAGLHADGDFTEYCHISHQMKVVYSDN